MLLFRRLLVVAASLVGIVGAGLVLTAAFGPRDRWYTVNAQTETVQIKVDDPNGLAAVLPVTEVIGAASPPVTLIGATLEIPDKATVVLQRKRNGPLFIRIDHQGAASGAAYLTTSDAANVPLETQASLRVMLDRPAADPDRPARPDTVLLAFQGEIRLGEDVTRLVETTLIGGDVSIIEREPLFGERYVVREARLDPGDLVSWRAPRGSPIHVSGFVQAGNGEALAVTSHGAAQSLSVIRLGTEGYTLRPSPWDRISKDPIANLTVILLGVVATLAGLLQATLKGVAGIGSKRKGTD